MEPADVKLAHKILQEGDVNALNDWLNNPVFALYKAYHKLRDGDCLHIFFRRWYEQYANEYHHCTIEQYILESKNVDLIMLWWDKVLVPGISNYSTGGGWMKPRRGVREAFELIATMSTKQCQAELTQTNSELARINQEITSMKTDLASLRQLVKASGTRSNEDDLLTLFNTSSWTVK